MIPKKLLEGLKVDMQDVAEIVAETGEAYFIRDNFKNGKISEGLSFATGINKQVVNNIIIPKPLSIQERADIRHGSRTEQQENDIQSRWDERKANLAAKTSQLDKVIQQLEKSNIYYNEVKSLSN